MITNKNTSANNYSLLGYTSQTTILTLNKTIALPLTLLSHRKIS